MTASATVFQLGAMRSAEDLRTRKNLHIKRDDHKVRNTIPVHPDFPYRFVFPANHPFSTFTQFLSPPPAATAYNSQNSYEMYSPPAPPPNSQSYPSSQPEYKFALKPQSSYQPNAQPNSPFPPNPLQVTPIPVQPGSSPTILLLHTGGNSPGAGPIQTFLLVPAQASEGNQQFSNVGVPQTFANLPTVPLTNLGLPPASVLPMTPASVPTPLILRPSGYTKSNANHFQHQLNTQLLQRPISVYPIPGAKYYPQKKNSIEPKMSSSNDNIETSHKPSSSTERTSEKINHGKRKSSSQSNSKVK